MKLALLALCLANAAWTAPAVILIVRHAEKAPLPADDPPLTSAGHARASELVRVVQAWTAAGLPLRQLFASEVKRTQQTLEPLAASANLRPSIVNAKDIAALVQRILAVDGGIVVVAGHSNTVPALIQALGGPAGIAIADSEFDRLFAVTFAAGEARVVALRYGATAP